MEKSYSLTNSPDVSQGHVCLYDFWSCMRKISSVFVCLNDTEKVFMHRSCKLSTGGHVCSNFTRTRQDVDILAQAEV